jgi:hypothetical protein
MGSSGDGEPKAARVLLGVYMSPLVLLFVLLFRRADGVSAWCCCFSGEIDLARSARPTTRSDSHFVTHHAMQVIFPQWHANSPSLRASRSCLPFSISSSSFRYRSLSSRSLFSDSSRTDFRKAAGSKSSSSAAASAVGVAVLSCAVDTFNGDC